MTSRPGYSTVSPYLVCSDPRSVMAFAIDVFGAEPIERPICRPDGSVQHVALRIGDSVLMIGGGPGGEQISAMVHVYVDDPDASFARALDAGAEVVQPMADQAYGDRSGGVRDAAGNFWWIASFRKHIAPEEIERRAREAAAKGA